MEDLLTRYGIINIWSSVSLLNRNLFSNTSSDPLIWADGDAACMAVDSNGFLLPYEVVLAIGPSGTIVIQTLVFKDCENRDKYLNDGVVVFSEVRI